jgi:hypothetical protein
MRSLLFGSTIIVLTLADLATAVGQKIHHDRVAQASYSACVCHWGYGNESSGDACAIAVSCNAEGGRCVRSCSQSEVGQAGGAGGPAPQSSSTSSPAELARKCDALTAKAFPPIEPGNPAAGSTKGSGLEAQSYFRKCITNDGHVDNSTAGH